MGLEFGSLWELIAFSGLDAVIPGLLASSDCGTGRDEEAYLD